MDPLLKAYGPPKTYFIVDEDQLRDKLLELSPQLRRDTEHLAELIREMIKLERQERHLDDPRGRLQLEPNKEKNHPSHPDLCGSGWVAGRSYRAAAWLKGQKIQIALLPP
jgi:hypothetical protein